MMAISLKALFIRYVQVELVVAGLVVTVIKDGLLMLPGRACQTSVQWVDTKVNIIVRIGTVTLVVTLVLIVRQFTEQITDKAGEVLGERVLNIVRVLCSKLPQALPVL